MSTDSNNSTPMLQVRGLKKYFPIYKGLFRSLKGTVKAVDDLSFDLHAKETLGIVGESGCGKTTVGRSLLRLIEPTDQFSPSFAFILSMATAARITPPFTTCCQKGETLSRKRPLLSTPMIRQPNTVPMTEPRPPESDVPPMTTAAIESSS